jgi:hypothetical protein
MPNFFSRAAISSSSSANLSLTAFETLAGGNIEGDDLLSLGGRSIFLGRFKIDFGLEG